LQLFKFDFAFFHQLQMLALLGFGVVLARNRSQGTSCKLLQIWATLSGSLRIVALLTSSSIFAAMDLEDKEPERIVVHRFKYFVPNHNYDAKLPNSPQFFNCAFVSRCCLTNGWHVRSADGIRISVSSKKAKNLLTFNRWLYDSFVRASVDKRNLDSKLFTLQLYALTPGDKDPDTVDSPEAWMQTYLPAVLNGTMMLQGEPAADCLGLTETGF
jgi:hypothetical protein